MVKMWEEQPFSSQHKQNEDEFLRLGGWRRVVPYSAMEAYSNEVKALLKQKKASEKVKTKGKHKPKEEHDNRDMNKTGSKPPKHSSGSYERPQEVAKQGQKKQIGAPEERLLLTHK